LKKFKKEENERDLKSKYEDDRKELSRKYKRE